MDDGLWTMDDGLWTMDDGLWTMDYGRLMIERQGMEPIMGEAGNRSFGLRCVFCGDLLDPVILLNRLRREATLTVPKGTGEAIHYIRKQMSEAGNGR